MSFRIVRIPDIVVLIHFYRYYKHNEESGTGRVVFELFTLLFIH